MVFTAAGHVLNSENVISVFIQFSDLELGKARKTQKFVLN
jgi:hypothetical protein